MDFEIEDDSGEFTPYGRDPYTFKSGSGKGKSAALFGGSAMYEDEEDYDFQYETEDVKFKSNPSGGGSASIPAFSPRPDVKQNKPQPLAANNMSAMDKAAQMLQKYSGKPVNNLGPDSTTIPSNKYKTGKANLSFDEDELSIDEDMENDEDYGNLSISSPGVNLKAAKAAAEAMKPAVTKTDNISSSKPLVPPKHNPAATNRMLQQSLEESVEDEDEDEDEDDEEDEDEDDVDDYSDEEFDDVEEDEEESGPKGNYLIPFSLRFLA